MNSLEAGNISPAISIPNLQNKMHISGYPIIYFTCLCDCHAFNTYICLQLVNPPFFNYHKTNK
jgi:hypothetical protein